MGRRYSQLVASAVSAGRPGCAAFEGMPRARRLNRASGHETDVVATGCDGGRGIGMGRQRACPAGFAAATRFGAGLAGGCQANAMPIAGGTFGFSGRRQESRHYPASDKESAAGSGDTCS